MTRWSRRPAAALGSLLLSCSGPVAPAPVEPDATVPFGAAALADLSTIAELRPPGTGVLSVSSYDRTGANTDFGMDEASAALLSTLGAPPFDAEQSCLYRDGDRYVLFDEVGPGVVDRVWMTGFESYFFGTFSGDVAFEFDDEPSPRWTGKRSDWFGGATAPFLAPLAGDPSSSSGGFYSVLPLSFAKRLRITSTVVPNYLNVTWTRLPRNANVTSFQPEDDTSALAAQLASAGAEDPKGVTPDLDVEGPLQIAPGSEAVLWEREGPGTVLGLELFPPGSDEIPEGLVLEGTWDGAPEPQVAAPLSDLFGASLGEGARSIAFGRESGRFYFYFPMPFARSARLSIRNHGSSSFQGFRFRLTAVERRLGHAPGYFHAAARRERTVPGAPDYKLLDAAGSGHVVGVVMTAGCAESGQCRMPSTGDVDGAQLEGDERISVDGSRWPQIHGTGLEDFFNGGFYFEGGAFALPTHGNPVQTPSSPRHPGTNLRSMYRVMLADAVPFRAGIRLTTEHGPINDVAAELSSTVFFYAIPQATTVQTDRVELDAGPSEGDHALTTEGRADRTLTSSFRGEASDAPLSAAGFEAKVTRFHIAIRPDNEGVRLRRLADIAAGRQSAIVRVNGQDIGTWATADVNSVLRWALLDFEVPSAATRGRRELHVELDARESPNAWTAYGYEAWSHVAAAASE